MSDISRPAALDQLSDLMAFVEAEAEGIFPPRAAREVLLAVEEVVTNVITHAYPEGGGEVRVAVKELSVPRGLRLIVADDGIAFDPLAIPDPDVSAPLEERQVGGLGILLIRRMMDRVAYERRGGENVLTMEKYVAPETEAGS